MGGGGCPGHENLGKFILSTTFLSCYKKSSLGGGAENWNFVPGTSFLFARLLFWWRNSWWSCKNRWYHGLQTISRHPCSEFFFLWHSLIFVDSFYNRKTTRNILHICTESMLNQKECQHVLQNIVWLLQSPDCNPIELLGILWIDTSKIKYYKTKSSVGGDSMQLK